jgi:hypothetical protein
LLRRRWRTQANGDLMMMIARTRGPDYAFTSLIDRATLLAPPCGWGFCELRLGSPVLWFSYRPLRLGIRSGTGTGMGFCGTNNCSSNFFKRPSIGLTFGYWNETRAGRSARSIQHKQKTPSTVWEGPDS